MAELYDVQGNPVEALTPEEVEAKIAEAKAAGESSKASEVETLSKEIADLKAVVAEKEKAIGGDDKTLNFKELRDSKKAAEDKIKELETTLSSEVAEIKKAIASGKIEKAIKDIVGDDQDAVKKALSFYEMFAVPEKDTAETFNSRIASACTLASKSPVADPLKTGAMSTGGGSYSPKVTAGKLTEAGKKAAIENFGLSAEDIKDL